MLRLFALCAVVVAVAASDMVIFDSGLKPPTDGQECPNNCGAHLQDGVENLKKILSMTKVFEVRNIGFANKCLITGLDSMSVVESCKTKDQGIFDHQVQITFKNLKANCTCELDNDPTLTAAKVNEIRNQRPTCGKVDNPVTDQLTYTKVSPAGVTGGAAMKSVSQILVNFGNLVVNGNIRADANKGEVYPTVLSLTIPNPDPYSYTGDAGFAGAFGMLKAQIVTPLRSMVVEFLPTFFPCMNGKNRNMITDAVVSAAVCK